MGFSDSPMNRKFKNYLVVGEMKDIRRAKYHPVCCWLGIYFRGGRHTAGLCRLAADPFSLFFALRLEKTVSRSFCLSSCSSATTPNKFKRTTSNAFQKVKDISHLATLNIVATCIVSDHVQFPRWRCSFEREFNRLMLLLVCPPRKRDKLLFRTLMSLLKWPLQQQVYL